MKRKIWIVLGILGLLGCLALTLMVINTGITVRDVQTPLSSEVSDVRAADLERVDRLRSAPWQGLRFLPAQREWRFYGVAAEQRRMDLIQPFDLVKVYYLHADGELAFTWAALGVEIPGEGAVRLSDAGIQLGDLVEVALQGEHVFQSGVDWEDCPSEYCRIAQRIDSLLILDDNGTGITNGFIREGWAPPTSPMYGFLCWQVRKSGNESAVATPLEAKP